MTVVAGGLDFGGRVGRRARRWGSASLVASLVGGLVVLSVGVAAAAPPPGECVFDATDGEFQCEVQYTTIGVHEFVAPEGVEIVRATAVGGAGGDIDPIPTSARGGVGGVATGLVPVPENGVLYAVVGSQGADAVYRQNGAGGFNGGGAGGRDAAGGGGASDVRTVSDSLDSRFVAGGGGGGSGSSDSVDAQFLSGAGGDAGNAGGLTTGFRQQITGGGAGTQDAGGAGGVPTAEFGSVPQGGDPGRFGVGGDGGTAIIGGSGGGAGWFGGGGGGVIEAGSGSAYGSGGGGSSYTFDPLGSTGLSERGTPASVTIRYTVNAQLTVTPAQASIQTGQSQTFTVTAVPLEAGIELSVDVSDLAVLTADPAAGLTCTAATCTAQTPGTYTVTATAGELSATSTVTVTPAPAPPGAPTITSVTGGDGQATVAFTPGTTGVPADTTLTVQATPVGASAPTAVSATAAGSPITVTGLTNGVTYTFTVTATNATGSTVSAPSSPVTLSVDANLAVRLTGPATAGVNAAVRYQITVTNEGPAAAVNVRTVLGASGLTNSAAEPATSTGTIRIGNRTVSGALWTTPTLAAGASVTYTLTGKANVGRNKTVIALGGATSSSPDPAPANNIGGTATLIR